MLIAAGGGLTPRWAAHCHSTTHGASQAAISPEHRWLTGVEPKCCIAMAVASQATVTSLSSSVAVAFPLPRSTAHYTSEGSGIWMLLSTSSDRVGWGPLQVVAREAWQCWLAAALVGSVRWFSVTTLLRSSPLA